jgi:hypothetical protein
MLTPNWKSVLAGAAALAVVLLFYFLIADWIVSNRETARQERKQHYVIAMTTYQKAWLIGVTPDTTSIRLRVELQHWMDSLAFDTLPKE